MGKQGQVGVLDKRPVAFQMFGGLEDHVHDRHGGSRLLHPLLNVLHDVAIEPGGGCIAQNMNEGIQGFV